MPGNELLRITDGTTYVNLLRRKGMTGFHLANWSPATATYKQGGIWRDSPFSDGRKMVDAQWQHPIENITLHLKDTGMDDVTVLLQDLRRLLEKANNYWKTDWQDEPVWIEARSGCETNIRYALIYDSRVLGDNNPYGQPFASRRHPIHQSLSLQIERGHWLSHYPGNSVCAETSGVQEDWVPVLDWTVNTNQPTSGQALYANSNVLISGEPGDTFRTIT